MTNGTLSNQNLTVKRNTYANVSALLALFSLVAFVLGTIGTAGLFLGGLGSIVGLIIGLLGLLKSRKGPAQYTGRGVAMGAIAANAITLVLAGAVIAPGMLTSQVARNEISAITSLKSIYEAEQIYKSRKGNGSYGSLSDLAASGLIDSGLADETDNGYRFELRNKGNSIEAHAKPLQYNGSWGSRPTGNRSFYLSGSGKIYGDDKQGGEADANDPLIN